MPTEHLTRRTAESAGTAEQSPVPDSLTSTRPEPCFYSYRNKIVKMTYSFGIRYHIMENMIRARLLFLQAGAQQPGGMRQHPQGLQKGGMK